MTLKEFAKKHKNFWWWVKDVSKLSPESIVEGTLNYGEWEDVQTLIKIMGIKKVAEIFRKETKKPRSNYGKLTKNYFLLYFDKHAQRNS